jgi:hypothetical protein
MFEKRHERVLPARLFAVRMAFFAGLGFLMLAASLAIGAAGYHWIAGFSPIDSIYNASMILTGMGPVEELKTDTAKFFASGYALLSGLVFISCMGILIAPIAHRVLHRFHVPSDDLESKTSNGD